MKPFPTLTIMIGIPGSGKTYIAKQRISDLNSDRATKRVNRDELRNMLDNGNYSRENEVFVISMEEYIVRCALFNGYNVIVDDTNLKLSDREHWIQIAKQHSCDFECFEINTPLEVCIARDAERLFPIGKERITEMYELYIKEKEKRK